MAKSVDTPLMKQYFEMKSKHPDAVLLFRVGDFYETYSQDAVIASGILGITLTKRSNGAASNVEMAGFPHHALDTYLPKLVRAGKRVAICEQLEDPKLAKKLVRRGITELVTPGISLSDTLLDNKENNFLAAITRNRNSVGTAFLDISTGEFLVAEGTADYIGKIVDNFAPKEILVERGRRTDSDYEFRPLITELEDWAFNPSGAEERLRRQFGVSSLKGFGIDDMPLAVTAAAAILNYLDITCHTKTSHISAPARIEEDLYVRLDRFTVRNLEIVEPLAADGVSLLDVMDRTTTPMGARTLRRWLHFPLKDPVTINGRLDIVEYMFRDPATREALADCLSRTGDLERLISKVSVGRVTPRELLQLRRSLEAVADMRRICRESDSEGLREAAAKIEPCSDIARRIGQQIEPEAPAIANRANDRRPLIRAGVDAELDRLREIAYSGKDYLLKIQRREIEATGISSLKISYNNVFGYYIEVTNTHRDKVPESWIRRQTLVNAERYITPELKEYETTILNAQEGIAAIEQRIYNELVESIGAYAHSILRDASVVARIDCLMGFATIAQEYGYNRPVVDEGLQIELRGSRHPVIERRLPPGEAYIANDVSLDNEGCQIMMITGPNMSGKSALLRQTALNVIMAQTGSYVPADSARIGITDKIFTRVGASDNISSGESTFMVEMNEAASILNNMSRRSLILFDELGRGTSTYDGISIAWAIVEYIHERRDLHPKTLFATHYHELNDMAQRFERIHNYNVSVREIDGRVVFLRKLSEGGSAHSFGIHVARLAGMPKAIVERAENVLHTLESQSAAANSTKDNGKDATPRTRTAPTEAIDEPAAMQLSIFQLDDPVLAQIRDEILHTDIDALTPLAALNKLNDIKHILLGK